MSHAGSTILEHPAGAVAAVRPVVAVAGSTGPTVEPLGSADWARWDRYVRVHSDGSLFHTMGWMHSVRDAFGHQPRYLIARRAGRVAGVLPLFQVNSWLGGRMLISVPYGVEGGPLADDETARSALVDRAIKLARAVQARTLELRCAAADAGGFHAIDGYAAFRRALPDDPGAVLGWLPRKARAAARNAENKYHLTVEFNHGLLRAVWRLYARSMRRLGSIAYPFRFFDELVARFDRRAFVQVVRRDRRIIAGLVSFRFGDRFMPYFAGCDERRLDVSPNNYLYLTAMRHAVGQGCRLFDFGRTRVANKGAYDFKRFHGFVPQPVRYQRWVAPNRAPADLTPGNPRLRTVRRLWKRLPLVVTRIAGPIAARHIPG